MSFYVGDDWALADGMLDADKALEFAGYGSFFEDEDGAGFGRLCPGCFPAPADGVHSTINRGNYDQRTRIPYETKSTKLRLRFRGKLPISRLGVHRKKRSKTRKRAGRKKHTTKPPRRTRIQRSLKTQRMKLRTRWVLRLTSTKSLKLELMIRLLTITMLLRLSRLTTQMSTEERTMMEVRLWRMKRIPLFISQDEA